MLPGQFDRLVLTASAARLWSLIEERTHADADVDKIDRTICAPRIIPMCWPLACAYVTGELSEPAARSITAPCCG